MIRYLVVSWVLVSLVLPVLLSILAGLVALVRRVRARSVDPETRALAELERLYRMRAFRGERRVS